MLLKSLYHSSQVPPIDQDPKFEQQMHQLMLDGDNCSSPLSLLRDQENIKPHVADQVYGFTPDTLGGGLNWPGKTSIKLVFKPLTDATQLTLLLL